MSITRYKSSVNFNKSNIRNNVLKERIERIEYYTHWLSVEEGNINEIDTKIELSLKKIEFENNKLIIHDNWQN